MQCHICNSTVSGSTAICPACGALLPDQSGSPSSSVYNQGTITLNQAGQKGQASAAQQTTRHLPPLPGSASSPPTPQPGLNSALFGNAAQQVQMLGKLIYQLPDARKPRFLDVGYRMHCPFCNTEFHPGECAVHSSTNYNKNHPEASLIYPAPTGKMEIMWARAHVKNLDGKPLFQFNPRRQCPGCKELLPYHFENNATFNIAIVGTGASGKTHYIVSLLHQIKEGAFASTPEVSVTFEGLTPYSKAKYKEYYETLIKNGIPLSGTPLQEVRQNAPLVNGLPLVEYEPFIFQLTIRYRQEQQPAPSVMNLIFYDIAGETITNSDKMIQFGWPILEAQAIIHVVDPMNLPAILDRLPTSPQVEAAKKLRNSRVPEHEVLNGIITLLQRYHKWSWRNIPQIPVAIMLSKSDVLGPIATQHGFANARFLSDAVYTGSVNVEDLNAVNQDVWHFLSDMGEHRLMSTGQLLPKIGFFAASATGCAPVQQRFPFIKPRRCLDPLFWVLNRLTEANTPPNAR